MGVPGSVCVRQLLEYTRMMPSLSHVPSRYLNHELAQIHDSDMITGHPLEHVINGPAHHTLHHLYFTVNYGQVPTLSRHALIPCRLISYQQYFTWADRAGGSYRQPQSHLDPLLEVPKEKTL